MLRATHPSTEPKNFGNGEYHPGFNPNGDPSGDPCRDEANDCKAKAPFARPVSIGDALRNKLLTRAASLRKAAQIALAQADAYEQASALSGLVPPAVAGLLLDTQMHFEVNEG